MTDDERWLEQKNARGWTLPAPAPWVCRLPVVRHLRYVWHAWHVAKWYSDGPGIIGIPTGYDEWALYALRRGWW